MPAQARSQNCQMKLAAAYVSSSVVVVGAPLGTSPSPQLYVTVLRNSSDQWCL